MAYIVTTNVADVGVLFEHVHAERQGRREGAFQCMAYIAMEYITLPILPRAL